MTAIDTDLRQIFIQATSLSERIEGRNTIFEIDFENKNKNATDKLLNRWCQVVGQGDWNILQKRLLWSNLSIETVSPMLGSILLKHDVSLPSWIQILRSIIQSAQEFAVSRDKKSTSFPLKLPIDPEQPLPFEDVLLPAVLVARYELMAQMKPISSPHELFSKLLEEEAYLNLERSLLQSLSNLCSNTLNFEFSTFRSFGHNLLTLLIEEKNQKSIYNKFINELLEDGLLSFFKKYPVLAKLIAIKVEFWVGSIGEFLQRLKADYVEIQSFFSNAKESEDYSDIQSIKLGKLTEIETSISDSHCNGRSVIIITFQSGLKLVYKPKNLGLDIEYFKFLNWLNNQNKSFSFKIIKILNRQNYGWVEYVKHTPCNNITEVQNFYERAGMLLCLLYVLNASDCHRENVIACSEHLVLIDIETLMLHRVYSLESLLEPELLKISESQKLNSSVLQIGLLPFWRIDKNQVYDTSGLGSIEPVSFSYQLAKWKNINTDKMQVTYEIAEIPTVANIVFLHGEIMSPNNHLSHIISGFEKMYCFLVKKKQSLLERIKYIPGFKSQQVRFVFRSTQVYSVILNRTLSPEFFQSGVKRSIELEYLCRAFLLVQNKPIAWPILHAELKALEQLDIPYFKASSDSSTLSFGVKEPIEQFFQEPSYFYILTRIQKLNIADLNSQVKIIKRAFDSKVAFNAKGSEAWKIESSEACRSFSFVDTDISQINPITHEQLLQEANSLAQRIQEQVIRLADGSVNWLGLESIPETERFALRFLDESLYKGRLGVALFFAALDYKQGNTHFNDLVWSALNPLRKTLEISADNLTQIFSQNANLGGTEGLGSIIYSLVKISHFLQNRVFLEDAQRVAGLITLEQISSDRIFDIMTGAAGTILALLVLYSETEDSAILDKAIACGNHLLDNRINTNTSHLAWKNIAAEKPLTGFSHGAAGIAYALSRLYAVTQKKEFLKAAMEGIAYERSVFSESFANWPDFRAPDQTTFGISWCHGAPGIALARLGSLSILPAEEIQQEAEVALQTTEKIELWGKDSLCCGNFGRFEVLLIGSQKLVRPQLEETIHRQVAWVVARAKEVGEYNFFPNTPRVIFNPTFFQGSAGVGYQLLRLAYPEDLPSVLLLE